MSTTPARTLYDKVFDDHVVFCAADGTCTIYIDRHLIEDHASPQAFEGLRRTGSTVRAPEKTLAVIDHTVPTTDRAAAIADPTARVVIDALARNTRDFGIDYFDPLDARQGIVHVIGPEQGFTLPGVTIACGDSHTSTHGAFGALAFGIGTSEVELVLATQTLLRKKAKSMRLTIDGALPLGVTAKDLILSIIGEIGSAGAAGHVVEFAGPVVRSLSMEGRMTICNMAIEAGATAAMIAPDEVTFDYLRWRPRSPQGKTWDAAVAYWRTLKSDADARFDRELSFDASRLVPLVTWGTSPEHVAPIDGVVPDPDGAVDAEHRAAWRRALDYMDLEPGRRMTDIPIDVVWIGSCTNGRIEDLREVARVVAGKTIAARLATAMIVPGSGLVKRQAEAEGLDVIFRAAGFEWREPGCSMCLGMNPDQLMPGQRCASTSNRNFEGRQGFGGRTHLVSPAMAAAAAIAGHFVDVRDE